MGTVETVTNAAGTTNAAQADTNDQDNQNNQNEQKPGPPMEPGSVTLEEPEDEDNDAEPGEENEEQPGEETPQELLADQTNEAILRTAANVMETSENRDQEVQEGDGGFDTLPPRIEETDSGGVQEVNAELRKNIADKRKGDLYKAVLVARTLEKGGKNPMAAGRASRFFNSSKWDTAADLNSLASSGVGLATTASRTNATATTVFQAASLVTNVITIVTTGRNLIMKTKKILTSSGKESVVDSIFLALGAAGDAMTMFVKGVAILKTIVSLAGTKGLGSQIINKLSNCMFLLTGATQLIGIANSINGLKKSYSGLKKQKAGRDGYRKKAMSVVERHKRLRAGSSETWTEKRCTDEAKALYRKEGAGLTEEEKDDLMMYVGLTKRVEKLEASQATTAVGLINLAIGLVSTGVSGANTIVNRKGAKNKTLTDAAVGMGVVANLSLAMTSGVKLGGTLSSKVSSMSKKSRKNFMKESLWGRIQTLTQDGYGLKGVNTALNAHPADQKTEEHARKISALYDKTEGQLKALGADYGKLIKAGSLNTFKSLLVEGV